MEKKIIYNIYCDESCYLEYDQSNYMGLGAVWIDKNKIKKTNLEIREIKKKHGLPVNFEFKWNIITLNRKEFYLDLIDYFFKNQDLHYRGLIAKKDGLDHNEHNGGCHNTWYYKMYYQMLLNIFDNKSIYNIYIDIKEKAKGGIKTRKLNKILCNKIYDFNHNIIEKIQIVDSKETELLQLADILTGAITYANRNLKTNFAKLKIIEEIQKQSGYNLLNSTLPQEKKFNIFKWTPNYRKDDE